MSGLANHAQIVAYYNARLVQYASSYGPHIPDYLQWQALSQTCYLSPGLCPSYLGPNALHQFALAHDAYLAASSAMLGQQARGGGASILLVAGFAVVAVTAPELIAAALPEAAADAAAADGGDSIAAQLQAHTDEAAAKFESGDIGLSPAQARAAAANPGQEAMFRGQVIDSAVKEAVARDPNLASLYITRSGEFGPDFLDLNSVPGTPRWYDVTTEDSWLAHVARYADFGDGTGIFYGGG